MHLYHYQFKATLKQNHNNNNTRQKRTKMLRVASTRSPRMHTQINKHHHPVRASCMSCFSCVQHACRLRGSASAHARAYGDGNTRNIQFNTIVTRKSITFNALAQRPRVACLVSPLSSSSSQPPWLLLLIVVFLSRRSSVFFFSPVLSHRRGVGGLFLARRGSETARRVKLARSVRTAQRGM